MNVLDLFSGIGGFSLGLERAGMRTVAFCEIEPFCRAVLAKHWPHVPCYDDVRTLTAERLRADGITVDVICGGFPCQDVSRAGRKAGIGGNRSGLFTEFARLIGEIRPRYAVLENVPGLLDRGMGAVLGSLASHGYDAEWHGVSAADYGADHERLRIWIVAYPAGFRRPEQGHVWQDAGRCSPDGRWQTTDALDVLRRGAVPALCRDHDGLPAWLDRLACRSLGNAVVPQIPEAIGRAILAAERR